MVQRHRHTKQPRAGHPDRNEQRQRPLETGPPKRSAIPRQQHGDPLRLNAALHAALRAEVRISRDPVGHNRPAGPGRADQIARQKPGGNNLLILLRPVPLRPALPHRRLQRGQEAADHLAVDRTGAAEAAVEIVSTGFGFNYQTGK